jgi:hypothetical protein
MHAILGAGVTILGAPTPAPRGFSLAPLATFVLAAALVAILIVGVVAIFKGGIMGKIREAVDRLGAVLVGVIIIAIAIGGLAMLRLVGTNFLKLGGIQ